jgi:hypothetical protein
MAMQYDVKSVQLAAAAEVPYRTRLKGILITSTSGGQVLIKDGEFGESVFRFDAVAEGNVYVAIPGEGILCETSIYMKTSTNASVTVFYG